jgi:hypothetical protein
MNSIVHVLINRQVPWLYVLHFVGRRNLSDRRRVALYLKFSQSKISFMFDSVPLSCYRRDALSLSLPTRSSSIICLSSVSLSRSLSFRSSPCSQSERRCVCFLCLSGFFLFYPFAGLLSGTCVCFNTREKVSLLLFVVFL